MKKLKPYVVYLKSEDDAVDVLHVPGTSVKDVRSYVEGNGRVLAIEEEPGRMPSVDKVVKAMEAAGCTKAECDLIMRTMLITIEGAE